MPDDKKQEILEQKTLDENEVEAVAGGKWCFCIMGGGGEPDKYGTACACVTGGGGEFNDEGVAEQKKKCRCWCFAYGDGTGWDDESEMFR